jgi:hypothetical protein
MSPVRAGCLRGLMIWFIACVVEWRRRSHLTFCECPWLGDLNSQGEMRVRHPSLVFSNLCGCGAAVGWLLPAAPRRKQHPPASHYQRPPPHMKKACVTATAQLVP